MADCYRIVDWHKHYENNRTRELKRMQWVPIPTKLDGDGYTELVSGRNGAAIYGCWIACVIVAGRCDPRGTLMRDIDEPHDSTSLARITRLPASLFEDMLSRAQVVGWIEVINPAPSCLEGNGIEGNRRERKEPMVKSSLTVDAFDAWWVEVWRKIGKQKAFKAYQLAESRLRKRGEGEPHVFLLNRVKAFATSPRASGDITGKLHPATWLNEGRYDDDESTWQEPEKVELSHEDEVAEIIRKGKLA